MLTLTDLFAGAGGSSTGAVQSGRVEVRMAANHWQRAVEVHNANHPDADHICADISQYDPRRVRKTDLLWASPECFAAGTLVLAERGLVPIEDVVVGDMVLTHKGRYRPVTHVLSRSADTIRLIGQGLTRGLEVTTEHPILTSLLGVTAWTKAADIGLSGRTRWATPTEHPAVNVPPIGGSRPIHVEDPRFAWLVGRWLGDGSLRVRDGKSSEAFITCGKHEAAELEQRLIWVHHDCGTCAPDLRWARRELRTAYVYANSHSEFAKWLLEHFGQHAHGKTVPAWAFGAPVEWRHALLDGYLSADGHDNGRGWQAASVSKNLALGVRLLAESLGHRVGLTYSHRDTWRIEGRAGRARPQWSVQWLHEIRRESSRTATEFDGKSWGTVKAIEPGNTGVTVYDITVKEDHSYVADGIVVHNCTNHSQAKGSKRPAQGVDLFGETLPDEAAERSRATMWDVVRFTEAHRYQAALVENVVEVVQWAPFRAWLLAMDSLDYDHAIVSCNSMHAQRHGLPAPQSRDRVYIGFWRKGNRAPDFEAMQRPRAYCGRCDAVVESRQAWKNGRTVGRYRRQYIYVCPGCGDAVEPGYLPAAAAIDWTIPGTRIGDRAKPLADKTRARIAAGIARYWGEPFAVERRHEYRTRALDEALATLTANETSRALAVPVEGREGKEARPMSEALRTMTTRLETALVAAPFIAELRGGGSVARSVESALATITAAGTHHGLVTPYYGSSERAYPTTDALGTVTTVDRHALITRHYGIPGGDPARHTTPAGETLRTLTANGGNMSIVTPGNIEAAEAMVDDCLFRMLEPHEVAAGMAFPGDYLWSGTRRERVRLAGNAVTPPAARDLIGAVVDSLAGAA